jgi:hypothetical protein
MRVNDIPDGYYATPDPDNADTMTYWRARAGRIERWPAKAWHGPARLLKRDAPADRDAKVAWMRAWNERYLAWLQRVVEAIGSDPQTCRAVFAALTVRCCDCGRVLTDAKSKTLGVGPECRRGHDEAWLAATLTPVIAEAHAKQVAP